MDFDFNFGAPVPVDSYFNSVTDKVEKLPSGATKSGNDPKPQTSTMDDLWDDVGSTTKAAWTGTKNAVKTVGSGVVSAVSAVDDVVENKLSSVQNNIVKMALIGVGIVLVSVWVLGKSGVIGQSASLAGSLK